jgi:uncharacterized membrane protein YcaP (DUF421 family)
VDSALNIDWNSVFVPTESIPEVMLRGTIMYLALFFLLRVFRRGSGSVGMADLLVIVIIADAAQNGMAGDSKSITEALILIVTIVVWNYFLDWLAFRWKWLAGIMEPPALLLVKNGRMLRQNMAQEMITREELLGQLRQQGIEEVSQVKECRLESDGNFSVIRRDGKPNEGNRTSDPAVN